VLKPFEPLITTAVKISIQTHAKEYSIEPTNQNKWDEIWHKRFMDICVMLLEGKLSIELFDCRFVACATRSNVCAHSTSRTFY
jgi:hypothetical protein